jgi:hypothetical protein
MRAVREAFAQRLARAYPDPPVLALATAATMLCRCEGVTLGDLQRVRERPVAARDRRDVKAELRCGMGACQGTMCAEAARAAVDSGVVAVHRAEPRIRPPLAPVTIEAIAQLDR